MSREIRELLNAERHGILATLSARREGWPFASVAPYAISGTGEPILLLSELAEHTRNIRTDPRASLLVQDHASLEDPQAGARVTLLGTVEPVAVGDEGAARARYVARHPQADGYFALADFKLYVLCVREARFVGGFGDMGWVGGKELNLI